MKIVFIENRYKTWFWEKLAKRLVLDVPDLEVIWIVQNPVFAPRYGKINVIPFPARHDLRPAKIDQSTIKISKADRNLNYFGGSAEHYEYYREKIVQILSSVGPNVVVGESTLFHELMAIEWCRISGVRYLQPIMIGYPGGRYTVYRDDTKESVIEHSDVPTDDECRDVLNAICKRQIVPDYMKAINAGDPERHYPVPGSFKDRLNIIAGYYRGERFNTPSPFVKFRLNRALKANLARWEAIARTRTSNSQKLKILYPMQLQPESNLDVWGQKYRDQAGLVKAIADSLPSAWELIVKLNPKVKYELSHELLQVVESKSNIIPLAADTKMAGVFDFVDVVATVTGTIAVECVLSGKPVLSFGPSIVDGYAGCVSLDGFDSIPDILCEIEQRTFQVSEHAERVRLIKSLYRTTFPGNISDPATRPEVMLDENIIEVSGRISLILKGEI
ncbi:hypothetical protein [Pseudomonas monteilii]|uniref:capsular polysaccharide export protein, LipB/KpsS family n=1 Tax=Pseudomonas monteilii TaxID=76759 RepID=UPI0018AAC567|nr:hypothetical protein [Pseudomonas monteilii]MBF8748654.1 hypothetical protein [Pseudomonas monteilii]